MANPIIGSPDAFTRQQSQPAPGLGQQGYGQPGLDPYQTQPTVGGVMTLDDVIAKTAITLGVVGVAAVAAFMLLPSALMFPALIGSGIVGLITVFMVAGRSRVPVGGVLFYAAVEGVFIGLFSKWFEQLYPGIVGSAVLATFVTAAATLFAYKFFNIRVTDKFRRIVTIATIALAGVLLVNFVLAIFGINIGVRAAGEGAGLLAIGISVLAVVLAVLNLVTDFDSVERGIAMRAPANESWRAAFGITVTMVWLYTEILRILSYFRSN